MSRGFVIVWEFQVKPGAEAEFIAGYGSDGRWVRLFKKAPGFIRTELARSEYDSLKFVTVDVWESRVAYETFRSTHEVEYQALDATLAHLTLNEQRVGSFYLE
jgi:heme-degrading monooxygenase HmoA